MDEGDEKGSLALAASRAADIEAERKKMQVGRSCCCCCVVFVVGGQAHAFDRSRQHQLVRGICIGWRCRHEREQLVLPKGA
jgi:hypothetical protein